MKSHVKGEQINFFPSQHSPLGGAKMLNLNILEMLGL